MMSSRALLDSNEQYIIIMKVRCSYILKFSILDFGLMMKKKPKLGFYAIKLDDKFQETFYLIF